MSPDEGWGNPFKQKVIDVKQILQNLSNGDILIAELPPPRLHAEHLLIRTDCSLISLGTEKMLVDFGKASLIKKASQQPEKVKQVIQKLMSDGLVSTLEAVHSKLDQPLALGYCNVGTVLSTGEGVEDFRPGDRVVSNGPHAEVVCVSKNLAAKIPHEVPSEQATFTVVGAIGLQGIRLLQPTLGETFVVIGLGLIGLLSTAILQANGCPVIGVDLDPERCALAKTFGAESMTPGQEGELFALVGRLTRDRGVDGVLITASTKSNDPVRQAAQLSRRRGRIVVVGVVGLELNRADFYEKELSFQVSCSYGPGRYDPRYEDKGEDYPSDYVRWTAKRNFEAILDLLREKKIPIEKLISHRYKLENASQAYEKVHQNKALGIILEYPEETQASEREASGVSASVVLRKPSPSGVSEIVVGVMGAGNFAGRTLLPILKKTGVRLKTIAANTGVNAAYQGKKFGFENATSDVASIFEDSEINTLFISTRHDSHASLVLRGLQANKRIFVEKPLAINLTELQQIEEAHDQLETPFLMVGFNRRFAPHIIRLKPLLEAVKEPKSFIMTVNAGKIPSEHWTQDRAIGGGRIIGEACHFIDLLRFLTGSQILASHALSAEGSHDTASFTLAFADGSIGTIHYFANGTRSFPKERLEVFCIERVVQLDNFRRLTSYGWPKLGKINHWRQDKGHAREIQTFLKAVQKGLDSPIPFREIAEVSRVSMKIAQEIDSQRHG